MKKYPQTFLTIAVNKRGVYVVCKCRESKKQQKQLSEVLYKKSILKNFAKITGKQTYNFLLKRDASPCFWEIFENNFLKNTSGRLLPDNCLRLITEKSYIKLNLERGSMWFPVHQVIFILVRVPTVDLTTVMEIDQFSLSTSWITGTMP